LKKFKNIIMWAVLAAFATSLTPTVAADDFLDENRREFHFEFNDDRSVQSMVYIDNPAFVFSRDFPTGSIERDFSAAARSDEWNFISPNHLLIRERVHFRLFSETREILPISSSRLAGEHYELEIGLENAFSEAPARRIIPDDNPELRTVGVGYEISVAVPSATAEAASAAETAATAARILGLTLAASTVVEVRANLFLYIHDSPAVPTPLDDFFDPIRVYMYGDFFEGDVFAVDAGDLGRKYAAEWDESRGMYTFEINSGGTFVLVRPPDSESGWLTPLTAALVLTPVIAAVGAGFAVARKRKGRGI
jgi:hypothetical protein